MDIISFHPLASLLFIDCTPQSNDTCLLTFMLGEIVTIFAAGRIAETQKTDGDDGSPQYCNHSRRA